MSSDSFYLDKDYPGPLLSLLRTCLLGFGYVETHEKHAADIVIGWAFQYDDCKSSVVSDLVSPAWVIGCVLSGYLLPVECYSFKPKNILSGCAISLVLSTPSSSRENPSYRHAYSTLIYNYGGKIHKNDDDRLCTHILRGSDTKRDVAARTSGQSDLLSVYKFLLDNFHNQTPTILQEAFSDESVISTVHVLPICVSELWLIDAVVDQCLPDVSAHKYQSSSTNIVSLSMHSVCIKLSQQYSNQLPVQIHATSNLLGYSYQDELYIKALSAFKRNSAGAPTIDF
jgi:hypothetical protein